MVRRYTGALKHFNPYHKKKVEVGICDKYMEFDDGKNCYGYVAYRMATKVIHKYYFFFHYRSKDLKLFVSAKSPHSDTWRKKEVKNFVVESAVWQLLKNENVVSQKLIEKVFAKFG